MCMYKPSKCESETECVEKNLTCKTEDCTYMIRCLCPCEWNMGISIPLYIAVSILLLCLFFSGEFWVESEVWDDEAASGEECLYPGEVCSIRGPVPGPGSCCQCLRRHRGHCSGMQSISNLKSLIFLQISCRNCKLRNCTMSNTKCYLLYTLSLKSRLIVIINQLFASVTQCFVCNDYNITNVFCRRTRRRWKKTVRWWLRRRLDWRKISSNGRLSSRRKMAENHLRKTSV